MERIKQWFSPTISLRDFKRMKKTLWRRQNCTSKNFDGHVDWSLTNQFPKIEISPCVTALDNKANVRIPAGLWHGIWRDFGRGQTRVFHSYFDISPQKRRYFNSAAPKNSYSILPKSDTLRVFVETCGRRRIELIESPGDTILYVRGKIFEVWLHNCCGGR